MVKLKLKLENKSFSLVEVIITVAILSTGIIAILQALSFSARATGLACDITNAVFLAKDKIQELEFEEKKGQINPKKDVDKKDKFHRELVIVNLEPDLKLYRLDFDITWQRLNKEEKLSLSSYLRNLK